MVLQKLLLVLFCVVVGVWSVSFQSSVLCHFVLAHIYNTKKLHVPVSSRYILILG